MDMLVNVQKACDRAVSRYRVNVEAERELRWIGYGLLLAVGAFVLGGWIAWFWQGAGATAIYCIFSVLVGVGLGIYLGKPAARAKS
jgi:hypothetical protein